MKTEEWIEAFKKIHDRLPTAKEFYDAKTNAEFISDSEDSNEHGIACPKCRTINLSGNPFCPQCGAKMDGNGSTIFNATEGFVGDIANKLNSVTGGEGTVELRMRDLFSEAFKPHTKLEAENIFACGSESTTPKPEDISREWPKPWYFTRVFGLLLASSLMLYFMYITFNNYNILPGLIFVLAMAGPIPVLFFFFESNSPRNIDIITVLEIFFIGGILSLVLTLALGTVFPGGVGDLVPSMVTGVVEEVGKILATAYFVTKLKDKRYIFNGLLIGGAVGAGFAVFETAGYILMSSLIQVELSNGNEVLALNPDISYSIYISILRGVLSIGGHVAWAAITGAGIMMVLKKYKEFNWSLLWTGESLRFLTLVIILHGIWDTNIGSNSTIEFLKLAILCVLAWIIIMIIINRGLKEINDLGKGTTISLNKNTTTYKEEEYEIQ